MPLGWPTAFSHSVTAHNALLPWSWSSKRETLTHRDTDRAVRALGVGTPLSVSADKLGSVAMRCALLQQRWGEEVWTHPAPRDGSGPLLETYPAAAFKAWRIPCDGYKKRTDPAGSESVREQVVNAIESAVGDWLDLELVRTRCIASDHVLDALVCALVAIAAKVGATHLPSNDQCQAALIEGWIHVPSKPLQAILPPSTGA